MQLKWSMEAGDCRMAMATATMEGQGYLKILSDGHEARCLRPCVSKCLTASVVL